MRGQVGLPLWFPALRRGGGSDLSDEFLGRAGLGPKRLPNWRWVQSSPQVHILGEVRGLNLPGIGVKEQSVHNKQIPSTDSGLGIP